MSLTFGKGIISGRVFAPSGINPNTLDHALLLDSSDYVYTSSSIGNWTGTVSVGSSGSLSLAVAPGGQAPIIGATLNGIQTVEFTESPVAALRTSSNTLFGSGSMSSWSYWCLITTPSKVTTNGPLLGYGNPPLLSDATPRLSLACRQVGIGGPGEAQICCYDGAFRGVATAMPLNTWTLFQARCTGGVAEIRCDSASWASSGPPFGAPAASPGYVYHNTNWTSTHFNHRKAAEGFSNTTRFNDDTFDGIKSYLNTRFGLVL